MSMQRKGPPEALSPEELAGHLDQQNLSAVDSEGPVLGRDPQAGRYIEGSPVNFTSSVESEGKWPTEPARHRLPARRQTIVREIEHHGVAYTVEIGLRPETGRPAEVFVAARDGDKQTASDHALLQDVATLVSLALQCGVPVQSML